MNSENHRLCEPVTTIPRKSQRGLNFASGLGYIEVHNTYLQWINGVKNEFI